MGKPPGVAGGVARRKRSESDRKKHAGWRDCPRCHRSVSTNGRNYFHHMHKCDPAYFADKLAAFDLRPTPRPPPHRPPLSEAQNALFVQQLCFLRIYNPAVDHAFRNLEAAVGGRWGAYSAAVFAELRAAQTRATADPAAAAAAAAPPHFAPARASMRIPAPLPHAPQQYAAPAQPALAPRQHPPALAARAHAPLYALQHRHSYPLARTPAPPPAAHSPVLPSARLQPHPSPPPPPALPALQQQHRAPPAVHPSPHQSPHLQRPASAPHTASHTPSSAAPPAHSPDKLMAFAHTALRAGPAPPFDRPVEPLAYAPLRAAPPPTQQQPRPLHRHSAPGVLQPVDVNRFVGAADGEKLRPFSAPAASAQRAASSSMSISNVVNNN